MTGPRGRAARRLRRYFLTGLLVLAPLGVTAAFLMWLFQLFDAILGVPLERLAGRRLPGVGLVLLLLAILGIGWVAHYAVGRQLITWWNRVVARFPIAGRIYGATSQILQTVVGSNRRIFLRTVLIEFPGPGSYVVAWVTAEDNPFAAAVVGEPCLNVFVATTPNPTSGYLLIVPKSRAKPVDLSIEDGMKLVISAGAVVPSDAAAPQGLDLAGLLTRTGP